MCIVATSQASCDTSVALSDAYRDMVDGELGRVCDLLYQNYRNILNVDSGSKIYLV